MDSEAALRRRKCPSILPNILFESDTGDISQFPKGGQAILPDIVAGERRSVGIHGYLVLLDRQGGARISRNGLKPPVQGMLHS